MSFYYSDTINIKHYTVNAETGVKVLTTTELNVECRVELNNDIIMSSNGKEEKASYLIMIDSSTIKELDGIIVKTVMGRSATKKEYDIKKLLPVGDWDVAQLEIYV